MAAVGSRAIFRQHFFFQAVEALDVLVDKSPVHQTFVCQNMHHPQSQDAISARSDQYRLIRHRCGGVCCIRFNHQDAGAVFFRFPHRVQEMDVGCQRMGTPENDKITFCRFVRLSVQACSHDRFPPVVFGGRAQSAFQLRSAESVKKRMAGIALQHAERPGI